MLKLNLGILKTVNKRIRDF